jgi:cyclopropane fatty-acyl-phospholipid synthase-like methyltransferase
MLAGKKNVLEIGCGDAFGMRLVLQTVSSVHGVDFDPLFVEWAQTQYCQENLKASFEVLDITKRPPRGGLYDAAYSLDFIEHIPARVENKALRNICRVLAPEAVCILGTPNAASSKYASRDSVIGHINLKDADALRKLMERYFQTVFLFSMNDEVVHTGFHGMAHYLFGLGVGVRRKAED